MGENKIDIRSRIEKELQNTVHNARLPRSIGFFGSDNELEIVLSKQAIGLSDKRNYNMQDDGAAFEAWAFILKRYYLQEGKGISITADDTVDFPEAFRPGEKAGHYGRFLYRVNKFANQYAWFLVKPGSGLERAVNQFSRFLRENTFVGNKPSNSSDKENSNIEHIAEGVFATTPGLLYNCAYASRFDIGHNDVHRQLAVGLFLNTIAKKNRVFTGGKSAIDLWTLNSEDAVSIFELKADNVMVGIISETMFYANYINDMFVITNNNIHPSEPTSNANYRGYEDLCRASRADRLKKVYAYFLTNRLHPLIDAGVIRLMNSSNGTHIEYRNAQYDLSGTVGV